MTSRRRDAGSASIWVLACAGLLAVVAAAAVLRGAAVLVRHRAEAAADLAALAAAGRIGVGDDGCALARSLAARNGARLADCTMHLAADGRSGTVVVAVVVRARLPVVGAVETRARARAGRLPATVGPVG